MTPMKLDSVLRLGMSREEIAKELGLTVREVKNIEDGAIKKIRRWLKRGDFPTLHAHIED